MDLGLTGKVALVLGSTSGLGLATAQRLAQEGAHVVVTGRRAELAEQVAGQWPNCLGLELDLTQDGAIGGLLSQVDERFGAVDILVLNGPGPQPAPAIDLDVVDVEAALPTLLLRQVELVRGVLPGMRTAGWGRIVGIGSSGVQSPLPGLALSNIARAGLAGYLKSLSHDVAAEGVTVNMVLPGRISTDRLADINHAVAEREGLSSDEVLRRSTEGIPARRHGHPEEFGDAVAFLCSTNASYITGEQLRVDGGLVRSY